MPRIAGFGGRRWWLGSEWVGSLERMELLVSCACSVIEKS